MSYVNKYTDEHWPNHWGDEDIECLNPFLRTEFNHEIVKLVNDPDYDWGLVDLGGGSGEGQSQSTWTTDGPIQ